MKKLLFISLIVFINFGCAPTIITQRETVYRDTTIYVKVPVVRVDTVVQTDSTGSFHVIVKDSTGTADINYDAPNKHLSAIIKHDTVKQVVRYESVICTPTLIQKPSFGDYLKIGGSAIILFAGIFLVLKGFGFVKGIL
jgi:hypothetical protein